jgi:protein-disulfide isomerase/uncharacterized membrane protein
MKRHAATTSSRPPSEAGAAAISAPSRPLLALALALVVLGLFVAGDLALIHRRVHTDPSYRSYCAISAEVNCDTVAESRYSVFLGVPVAAWGLLGYAAVGVLALTGLRRRRLHPGWPAGALVVLATVAVLASVPLALISKLVIRSLCLLCLASWTLNLALLVLAIVLARRTGAGLTGAVAADLRALAGRPRVPAGLTLGAVIVLGALIGLYPRYWETTRPAGPGGATAGIDAAGLPWIGASRPRLTITEFSDYECPHCRRAHTEIRAVVESRKDVLRLVHRHYPLDDQCNPAVTRPFHRAACRLAAAAICAGAQGRFWEMNDALFETAAERDVVGIAARLKLDVPAFRDCLAAPRTAAHLSDDIRVGASLGVRGTPAFAIGADLFRGQIPPGEIERRLGPAPAAASGSAP